MLCEKQKISGNGITSPHNVTFSVELHPNSFSLWRMRMKGRTTKHRTLRSPEMKFDDQLLADHRWANF